MKRVALASCSDDMYSPLAFQAINRHSVIVVCTIKHPKNDDTIVRIAPSLTPSWNNSVGR